MPGPFSARGPSVIALPEGPAAIRLDPCKRWPQKGPKRRPPRAIVRTVRKTDEAPQGQALAQTRRQPSIAGAAGRYIRPPALPHGDRRRMPEGSDGRGGLREGQGGGPPHGCTPFTHLASGTARLVDAPDAQGCHGRLFRLCQFFLHLAPWGFHRCRRDPMGAVAPRASSFPATCFAATTC